MGAVRIEAIQGSMHANLRVTLLGWGMGAAHATGISSSQSAEALRVANLRGPQPALDRIPRSQGAFTQRQRYIRFGFAKEQQVPVGPGISWESPVRLSHLPWKTGTAQPRARGRLPLFPRDLHVCSLRFGERSKGEQKHVVINLSFDAVANGSPASSGSDCRHELVAVACSSVVISAVLHDCRNYA